MATTGGAMVAAAKAALDRLKSGKDAAVKVDPWTRAVAVGEGRSDGPFASSLGRRSEVGWGDLARETFGSLLGEATEAVPQEEAPEGAAWMREALDQARSLPEWRELAARAEGDSWAAGLASAAALDVLAQTLPALPTEDGAQAVEELEYLGALAKEHGATPQTVKAMADAKRRLEKAKAQDAEALAGVANGASRMRSALRGAAAKASQEIQDAEDGLVGLGAGKEPGQRCRLDAPRQEVLQALRSNAKLARIAKLAGRLRAQAVRKQSEKTDTAASEISDVVLGGDVARLLPSELALLADEDTEVLLYAKLAERRALQYLLTGREPKAEGPIVLAIDESGSMAGARDEWAKAVALALAEVASRQKRAFVVLHFSTCIAHEQRFDDPSKLDFAAVLDLCTHFVGGGTTINAPLVRAAEIVAEAKKANAAMASADVVLITDGEDGDDHEAAMKALHALGARVFGFAVASEFSPEFAALLDHVEQISDADFGAGAKLDRVFSI